jgi:hypothetical protein
MVELIRDKLKDDKIHRLCQDYNSKIQFDPGSSSVYGKVPQMTSSGGDPENKPSAQDGGHQREPPETKSILKKPYYKRVYAKYDQDNNMIDIVDANSEPTSQIPSEEKLPPIQEEGFDNIKFIEEHNRLLEWQDQLNRCDHGDENSSTCRDCRVNFPAGKKDAQGKPLQKSQKLDIKEVLKLTEENYQELMKLTGGVEGKMPRCKSCLEFLHTEIGCNLLLKGCMHCMGIGHGWRACVERIKGLPKRTRPKED